MEYQTFRTVYLKTFERYLEVSALMKVGNIIKYISSGLSFMTGGGGGNAVRGASTRLAARGVSSSTTQYNLGKELIKLAMLSVILINLD